MVVKCPKCGRIIPEDSIYCPYCGHGIQPFAKTTQVSAGATLIIVAAVAFLIHFIMSLRALSNIYSWYPPLVAQNWIGYDQMLTGLTFAGLMLGFSAGSLSLARRSYLWAMASAVLCTFFGAVSGVLSIVIPFSNWGYSTFYFFLPLFLPTLIGTLLILPRRAEFKK